MLLLASKSPRRRELLARLGVPFDVVDVDVPEHRRGGESPDHYVDRVARDKARAGLVRADNSGCLVLGSDTEVVLGDEVFGKPGDAADAEEMLGRLSGNTHRVLTAVWLVGGGAEHGVLVESQVSFAELHPAQVAAYVATGEAMGKAGGYAIQGGAEVFVSRLQGSYSGVMGLPLHETARLLARVGLGPLRAVGA